MSLIDKNLKLHNLRHDFDRFRVPKREYKEDKIRMKCPYCGSERIVAGISWGKTADIGNIGLKYNEGIFVGVSQVYSDLCVDCKSILRTYILDNANRNWSHNPGSF